MAKKIIALVAAVALTLCFAVSASAINVATTTTYDNAVADANVKVTVTVTGVDVDANVTYYATKDGANVHIDQEKATAEGAKFVFNTKEANLKADVKVGYTASGTAKDAVIEGNTISILGDAKVYPTETNTVSFSYDLADYHTFAGVEVTGATATATYADGVVTVVFSEMTNNVAITEVKETYNPATIVLEAKALEAGSTVVVANDTYDAGFKIDGVVTSTNKEEAEDITDAAVIAGANADAIGDRKLTVIGQVSKEAKAYGVIISSKEIKAGPYYATEFAKIGGDVYEGKIIGDDGIFAIQLIDTANTENGGTPFVVEGETYHTAVYAYDGENYIVGAGSTTTVSAPVVE